MSDLSFCFSLGDLTILILHRKHRSSMSCWLLFFPQVTITSRRRIILSNILRIHTSCSIRDRVVQARFRCNKIAAFASPRVLCVRSMSGPKPYPSPKGKFGEVDYDLVYNAREALQRTRRSAEWPSASQDLECISTAGQTVEMGVRAETYFTKGRKELMWEDGCAYDSYESLLR